MLENEERKELGRFILSVMLPNVSATERMLYIKYLPLEEEDETGDLFDKWVKMVSYLARANKAFVDQDTQCKYMRKYLEYAQQFLPSHVYKERLDRTNYFCGQARE